jgi:hypothetical protein
VLANYPTGQEIIDRRRAAAIWHVHRLETLAKIERLDRQVADLSQSLRAIRKFARIGFRRSDQIGKRIDRQIRPCQNYASSDAADD